MAAQAGLGQQAVGHGQHQFGVAAGGNLAAGDHLVAVDQGDGAGFGGGFDGKQIHRITMVAAGAMPGRP